VHLTTHLHFVRWLKMSGVIPLLLLSAFMVRTGKSLPFLQEYFVMSLTFFLARFHEILGKYAQSLYSFNLNTISTCKNII